MNLRTLCDALKDLGVVEIILEVENEQPRIELRGRYESDHFEIIATNSDFAEHGL